MTMLKFKDREQAGMLLAERLTALAASPNTIVLALPRGGVPVGYQIARELQLPLDVLIVRKIGAPFHPELAIGAIASGGGYTINRGAVEALQITSNEFLAVFARELEELHRREHAFRGYRPPLNIVGKTAILVDDGAATGSTMAAAIDALRHKHPEKLVVALPVASIEASTLLSKTADEVICLFTPEPFRAVGLHYADFAQTSDDEVRELLARASDGKIPTS
ncbi:MAG: phosphoribosyltransferase [Vulcanimicrobiaceae bacterium]